MTPRNALNLIDGVVARFQGTREDHASLQQAIIVLNGLVVASEQTEDSEAAKKASKN